jgi:hypothetical protein
LTAAAVMRFTGAGLGRATKTNLGKVHNKLKEQWKGVTDAAGKDSLSTSANAPFANLALPAGANFADERVRTRYVQLRQIQAFPTSFSEAFWPDPSVKPGTPQATAPYAWSGYVAYLAELGIYPDNETTGNAKNPNPWGTISPDVQASVCLLMILEKGPKNTGVTADEIGSGVGLVALKNGFGSTRGILDGWRKPVLFTRRFGSNMEPILTLQSPGADGRFNTVDDVVVVDQ